MDYLNQHLLKISNQGYNVSRTSDRTHYAIYRFESSDPAWYLGKIRFWTRLTVFINILSSVFIVLSLQIPDNKIEYKATDGTSILIPDNPMDWTIDKNSILNENKQSQTKEK